MSYSHQLACRVKALEGCAAYLAALGQELRYTMAPMDRLALELAGREEFRTLHLAQSCKGYLEKGYNFTVSFGRAAQENQELLGQDGREALAAVADVMGAIDLQGQLAALELGQTRLGRSLDIARRRRESHSRLYTNVGLLSGAALAILLW